MKYNKSHGLSQTRVYSIYNNMIHRCYNEKVAHYDLYGGRGIRVCDEWRNSVEAFYEWAINNGYDENLTIDRIDSNGNYEPSNCKWATMKVQQNNKRSNLFLTINGETHTVTEWSRLTGIPRQTIQNRHYAGKTGEDLIKKRRV